MNNLSVAPKVSTRQKALLDLKLFQGRLLSPSDIAAFKAAEGGGTELYLSSGMKVTATFYEPAQIAKTLKPYLKEPLIAVRRPMPFGILPNQESYFCGEAIMGLITAFLPNMDGGGAPGVRVFLRGGLMFDIWNVSREELNAAFEEACGAELLVVRPVVEAVSDIGCGSAGLGLHPSEYIDLYQGLARRAHTPA